jgi:type IV pilus assembly protein PilO
MPRSRRRSPPSSAGSTPTIQPPGPPCPKAALCSSWPRPSWSRSGFVWLTNSADELEAEQKKEVGLREDYKKKLVQAVNLDALRKQREQVQQYVTQLEKQLPSKAEMDALLSDINQAGLGRSLNFDCFRPGQVSVREYYAELPISVRVTGPLPRHRLRSPPTSPTCPAS